MSNILFLGGAGFLGSNIIRTLKKRYDQYNVVVLTPPNTEVSYLRELDVEIIFASVADTKFIAEVIIQKSIDVLVHLVSTLIPGSDFFDYQREFEKVIFPSIEIMEICAKHRVRFVYFSSGGAIYGNRADAIKFKEEDVFAPISYYGWSKQIMENGIQFMHRTKGLEYLILRPSNPYGHGQNIHANQGLIAVCLGKILEGKALQIWGDGNNVRDYIYIDDLALYVANLLYKEVNNTILNLGSGEGYSINNIVDVLKDVVDEKIAVEYLPSRKVDVSNVVLETQKLETITTINKTNLKDGIRTFYRQLKSCEI